MPDRHQIFTKTVLIARNLTLIVLILNFLISRFLKDRSTNFQPKKNANHFLFNFEQTIPEIPQKILYNRQKSGNWLAANIANYIFYGNQHIAGRNPARKISTAKKKSGNCWETAGKLSENFFFRFGRAIFQFIQITTIYALFSLTQ